MYTVPKLACSCRVAAQCGVRERQEHASWENVEASMHLHVAASENGHQELASKKTSSIPLHFRSNGGGARSSKAPFAIELKPVSRCWVGVFPSLLAALCAAAKVGVRQHVF